MSERVPDLTVPAYAASRADYGTSRRASENGAVVLSVAEESPAWDLGIEPGMRVLSVNGRPLRDMTVWLWETDDLACDLEVFDPTDQTVAAATMERFPGEDWGLEFDGAVFDGMRTCVNACKFCFMSMLPKHMRNTLYIRDDDYRLSFLQGNFVTLTNMSDEDVDDVIDHALSPMNVSLHAVSPDVRRYLMGKNAQRGMDVLERLIEAGIEIHAQIVLCPGLNDGDELVRSLAFCEAHPEVTSLGIVPLGYTKHQSRFTSSFSDDPAAALAVIEQVRPYQERARMAHGRTVYQLADEFYLDAGVEVPAAETYDGYPQYYDGIGMVRTYLDETDALAAEAPARIERVRAEVSRRGVRLVCVSGRAARSTIARFVEGCLGGEVLAVKNEFFGGNVDVSGLICGCDLLKQMGGILADAMLFLPDIMFNADGNTLDGYHQEDIVAALAKDASSVSVTSTMPHELLAAIESQLGLGPIE
ncbi:MAG: DUF512 domain-containing protein [Coriobacteriaceae bacterium]|nr:DUF512 domain-containing protein [Coriobacteriaceae bacterium]